MWVTHKVSYSSWWVREWNSKWIYKWMVSPKWFLSSCHSRGKEREKKEENKVRVGLCSPSNPASNSLAAVGWGSVCASSLFARRSSLFLLLTQHRHWQWIENRVNAFSKRERTIVGQIDTGSSKGREHEFSETCTTCDNRNCVSQGKKKGELIVIFYFTQFKFNAHSIQMHFLSLKN